MTIRGRARRLFDQARRQGLDQPPGCPACRDRRGRIVYATSQCLADDTVVPVADHPVPCAACGIVPEFVIEAVRPWGMPD